MKKLFVFLLLAFGAGVALGEVVITPTDFLDTSEPKRMNRIYIDSTYGDTVRVFVRPTGGAILKIPKMTYDLYLYIFCDAPLHRLVVFKVRESAGIRTPQGVKTYGKRIPPVYFGVAFTDSTPQPVTLPYEGRDSTGCFDRPVDVVSSSKGGTFNPESDFIYVADQGNMRIVKLMYSESLDSLIWVETFGKSNLFYPTAIAYANYGSAAYSDDDIFVTDAHTAKLIRFSAAGVFEADYGGFGSSLGSIGYPTGVAISTDSLYPNRIYVCDSYNHRVVRYYSETNGPIMAERQYIFPRTPEPMICAVETDGAGNVYVIDSFADKITILSSNLDQVLKTYGSRGYDPGQFDRPKDLYIDFNEMQVCEIWADSAGIQSFRISQGQPRPQAPLPEKFSLSQNYPNPFNSNTIIEFTLPQDAFVNLSIYDILGRRVMQPVDSRMPSGRHAVNVKLDNVASGVYFYVLTSDKMKINRKMVLLR